MTRNINVLQKMPWLDAWSLDFAMNKLSIELKTSKFQKSKLDLEEKQGIKEAL